MSKIIQLPKSVATLTDEQLGRQLVDQYERACSGMVEYIAFGALAANAKVRIESTRGPDTPHVGGKEAKGTGFKGWLEEFTGGVVTKPTAYRYIDLAEIVRSEMGLGQRIDMYHVLRGEKLDEKEKKLRAKITDFVAGKSQRQLLIGAGKWDAPSGPTRNKKESEEERHQRLVEAARGNAIAAFSALHEVGERWMLIKDEELQLAIEDARRFAKQAESWLKTPQSERVQFKIESLLDGEATT